MASDFGFHPVDETDAAKLARQVDLPATRRNGLVPNQEERRHDALGAGKAYSNAHYANALSARAIHFFLLKNE